MDFYIFIILLFAILGVLTIVASWRLFNKAGYSGWKSIIPIFNVYVKHQIAFGKNSGKMFLITFIPIVGLAYLYYIRCCFTRSFGGGDFLSTFSMFFPSFASLFLGLGSKEYKGVNDNFLYNFIKH